MLTQPSFRLSAVCSKSVVEGVARVRQGDDRTHSPTETRRIQRANINLLNKLNGIQRKGGVTNSWQAQPTCKHKTSSAVNRLSSQRKIEGQNMVRSFGRRARACVCGGGQQRWECSAEIYLHLDPTSSCSNR